MVVSLFNNYIFEYNDYICMINFGYKVDEMTRLELEDTGRFFVEIDDNASWTLTFLENSNVSENSFDIPKRGDFYYYYYVDESGKIIPTDYNRYIYNLYYY